jgi:hypothetical protein
MPVSETTRFVVSTSMRLKFAALSATSLDLTEAVIVESSTYSPAVWPVIDVHAVADRNSASAAAMRLGLRIVAVMMKNPPFLRSGDLLG